MGIFSKKSGAHQWRGVIEEYRHRLPVSSKTPVITLREGGTPLIYACVLSEMLGNNVWVKFEGINPTGSFKDRGMTMAISKAAEEGAKAVICASTGNTSAAAAAYAVKAGMVPAVLIPEGKIALGKLAQAVVHGAKLLQVDGNFDDCLVLARDLSEHYPVSLVNSVNPYRIEGQKTAAFEVVDMLGDAPVHRNFRRCGASKLQVLHLLLQVSLLQSQRQLQQRFVLVTQLHGNKRLKLAINLVDSLIQLQMKKFLRHITFLHLKKESSASHHLLQALLGLSNIRTLASFRKIRQLLLHAQEMALRIFLGHLKVPQIL